MSFESLLTKSVSVKRATSTTTSATGEETKVYTQVATGVACDIQILDGAVVRYSFGEVVESRAKGYFLAGADIREGDRIVDGAIEWDVIFVHGVRGHHLEVDLHRGLKKG